MTTTRPKRPSADKTRSKILKTASQLFMEQGYSGTSMGKLAEQANVNQTLIFHHFGSKQQLWQQVKAIIVVRAKADPINPKPENLIQFLSEIIEQRVSLYMKCPELKRLISWQKLEPSTNKQNLTGISNHAISPLSWKNPILFLQAKKLLNSRLKPELIIVWLVSSINGLLDDDLAIFKDNPKNQKHYKEMLITSLAVGLKAYD